MGSIKNEDIDKAKSMDDIRQLSWDYENNYGEKRISIGAAYFSKDSKNEQVKIGKGIVEKMKEILSKQDDAELLMDYADKFLEEYEILLFAMMCAKRAEELVEKEINVDVLKRISLKLIRQYKDEIY